MSVDTTLAFAGEFYEFSRLHPANRVGEGVFSAHKALHRVSFRILPMPFNRAAVACEGHNMTAAKGVLVFSPVKCAQRIVMQPSKASLR